MVHAYAAQSDKTLSQFNSKELPPQRSLHDKDWLKLKAHGYDPCATCH
jgi:hypothetical protein